MGSSRRPVAVGAMVAEGKESMGVSCRSITREGEGMTISFESSSPDPKVSSSWGAVRDETGKASRLRLVKTTESEDDEEVEDVKEGSDVRDSEQGIEVEASVDDSEFVDEVEDSEEDSELEDSEADCESVEEREDKEVFDCLMTTSLSESTSAPVLQRSS